ncbi:MAG: hypothetical protein ACE5D6_07180 [Candidatus Zixiibacteriota bacterium]
MKNGQSGIMVTMTIVLIIGIVLLQVIFSTVSDTTATTAITNDPFTAVNGTCTRITSECYTPSSLSTARHTTDTSGNFTECGDSQTDLYGVESNSASDFTNFTQENNATYIQRSCSFITGGVTRIVINNLSVLFALALLIFVAGFVALK